MNKKKLLSIGFAAVFAAVMAFNVNLSSSNNSLSDLTLANIEALARVEEKSGDCEDCTGKNGTCWKLSGWQCIQTNDPNDKCICMW